MTNKLTEWWEREQTVGYSYTYTGRLVRFRLPDPEMITLEDIAHHLACINRFNGACVHPYSVAEHSMQVADLVGPELRLRALLHDAHEAYLGDITMPVKQGIASAWYSECCERIDAAIAEKFGLDDIGCEEITQADKRACEAETADLIVQPGGDTYAKGLMFPERHWLDVKNDYYYAVMEEMR